MQAILLAGGFGTRLQRVVSDRPKPMAMIGEKPFLEYVLHELGRNGIYDIIFAIGYKGSMVEEYFKDGSRFGIQVTYSYEEVPLGTAGAIKNASSFIKEDKFFVLNADTFYQLDYSRLIRLEEELNLELALVLREVPDISRYGMAKLKEGRLIGFNEKATIAKPGTINGGVYLMKKSVLNVIPEGKVSLENEIIPMLLRNGHSLGGMVNDGYFIDIGIPQDYFKFIKDVETGVIAW